MLCNSFMVCKKRKMSFVSRIFSFSVNRVWFQVIRSSDIQSSEAVQMFLGDYLKHFEPRSAASGWPCKFCTRFSRVHCYAVRDLCSHWDAQSWGQVLGKAWKNLLLILCILMHACVARCFISARSSWFILQLADWPVISSYNKPIKCHNITSKVQRWQCSWGKVKAESSAEVSLSRTINQFKRSWEPPTLRTIRPFPSGDHHHRYNHKQAENVLNPQENNQHHFDNISIPENRGEESKYFQTKQNTSRHTLSHTHIVCHSLTHTHSCTKACIHTALLIINTFLPGSS